jgi:hypothetical protein
MDDNREFGMSPTGNHRETGGRVLTPKTGRDASDEVSQKAKIASYAVLEAVKELAITAKAPGIPKVSNRS